MGAIALFFLFQKDKVKKVPIWSVILTPQIAGKIDFSQGKFRGLIRRVGLTHKKKSEVELPKKKKKNFFFFFFGKIFFFELKKI